MSRILADHFKSRNAISRSSISLVTFSFNLVTTPVKIPLPRVNGRFSSHPTLRNRVGKRIVFSQGGLGCYALKATLSFPRTCTREHASLLARAG